jgi:hypothetical protein
VYDASKALIGFRPRFSPQDFKCFFAASTGWGRYSQRITRGKMTARLSVYHGAVTLREVRLSKEHAKHVSARVEREPLALSSQTVRGCVKVKFKRALQLREGQSLEVRII